MPAPKFKFAAGAPEALAVDLLAIPVFQDELGGRKAARPEIASVLEALGGVVQSAAKDEGFKGKAGDRLILHTHGKLEAPRLMLLGLGTREDHLVDDLRVAAAVATRTARAGGLARLGFVVPAAAEAAPATRAVAEAAVLGNYRFDRYRSDDGEDRARNPVKEVTVVVEGTTRALKAAAQLGADIADAANLARDLVNEPAGVVTPEALAQVARGFTKSHGLKVTVRGPKDLEKLNMGMFLGVAKGSEQEARFITIEYKPTGRAKGKGVAIVGKGITFDSGGYDLKPAQAMGDMKMDMAGAAAAISVMKAVAAIKPPFPVTAYAGCAENMVSGRAYKPGDVLTSRKGKTVEINNTDAEGRLVLGDVLTYASEQGYDAIVDLATLTGACMVALGPYTVGCMSNDDGLAGELLDAGKKAGESLWRLPLNPDLKEQLKSEIADMKNTGERFGGAITAGLFLQEFVGDTKWVHLDIAGPAMQSKEKGVNPTGASGVGVRTLAQWILDRSGRA